MNKNWIFLRGWGRDARHWGGFVEQFKQTFTEHSVYLLDIPGTGQSVDELCPASVGGIVDQLVERWQQAHPHESAHILALSLGGMLAIDWMSRYPDMIESVVLMNSSSRDLSPFYQRLQYRIYPDLLRLLLRNQADREKLILELTSNLYPFRSELAGIWAQYALAKPVTIKNLLRQLWAAAQYSLAEQKPQQPILLLSSLADKLVHPDCSQAIADKWQLPLQRHPTAGHDITLDVPLWVLEQLKIYYAA